MSEHQHDTRISEICVDPNPLMVERQDQDNFTRFQTRERCALEKAAYVFKRGDVSSVTQKLLTTSLVVTCDLVNSLLGNHMKCFNKGIFSKLVFSVKALM